MKKETLYVIGVFSLMGTGIIAFILKMNALENISNIFLCSAAVIVIICFVAYKIMDFSEVHKARKAVEKYSKEMEARKQEAKIEACKVFPRVKEDYQGIEIAWNRPNQTLQVEFSSDSPKFSELICNCWIDGTHLYLLEQFKYVEERVYSYPYWFTPEADIKRFIANFCILISDIHHFRVSGEVFKTTEVLAGEIPRKYIGVSINGIGFGEMQGGTPTRITQTVNDTRKVVLFYREQGTPILQKIYFTYDSYEALIQLIPEKEHIGIDMLDD